MSKPTNDCGCDRDSGDLISVDRAMELLLGAARPLRVTESVDTISSLNRVLAASCISAVNVPPMDNSAMDGYALRVSDVGDADADAGLPVSQRICAGDTADPLQPGTVARIFTGAPVPAGADAVIMQEQAEVTDDKVCFTNPATIGQNIRRSGEDVAVGDEILTVGTRLRGQEMGLAASIGLLGLEVYRKLKVGIFFTGDELSEPGQELAPGKIYDSNRFTLHGLLSALGCEIIDLGIVEDTLDATRTGLQAASDQADLVVTSGGVSVGEEDYVRIALEELGELTMWRIAMKPGKPLAFGHVGETPFIGLPGNPVSVFATFNLFATPFIKKMQGMANYLTAPIPVIAGFDWPREGNRQEYLRVKLEITTDGQRRAQAYPHQGSGVLTSTSWADGFIVVSIGETFKQGDLVNYLPFSEFR